MNIWHAWQELWILAGPWGQAIIAFAFGAMIGSFVNVCAIRIPAGRNIWVSQSACPVCNHKIRPWHNWPVVGFLMLGGKCYDCKAPISPRYVLVEVACGLGFMSLELLLGIGSASVILAVLYAAGLCMSLILQQKGLTHRRKQVVSGIWILWLAAVILARLVL